MGSKSIQDWATSHGLSRSFFYVLKKRGHAPKTFRVGAAVRISDEADTAWIKAREFESTEPEAV
jgi:predicted DNA-binding transcriptional regulator AlpA